MIYEYAFDPQVFSEWSNCRYLAEMLGFSKGRVISKFPKKWSKHVIDSIPPDCSDITRTRIVAKLKQLAPCMINSNREYVLEKQDWMSNALFSHNLIPFRAVVSASDPNHVNSVINVTDIEEGHELWDIEHSCAIIRDSIEIVNSLRLLLLLCRDLIIVEPHFKPAVARFKNTLVQILQTLQSQQRRCDVVPSITIIKKYDPLDNDFSLKCSTHFKEHLTSISGIRFICLSEFPGGQRLHNRFVLTNLAGISLGIGFDEQPDSISTDDAFILDSKHHLERWKMYSDVGSHFTIENEFVIKK